LIARNICPSCHQLATGTVFPAQQDQTFYQDDRVSCHLESYPRGIGHTIIVARAHYADIAEMPLDLGYHMLRMSHTIVNALKTIVGADKVYLVTMCSGRLSHLHWQLIPRRPGEMIGGRVFASERGVLTNHAGLRDALAAAVQRHLAAVA
jgi:histidine triad (HIT) family protein